MTLEFWGLWLYVLKWIKNGHKFFTFHPIKKWSLFPHLLNLSWLCELLLSTEWGRSDSVLPLCQTSRDNSSPLLLSSKPQGSLPIAALVFPAALESFRNFPLLWIRQDPSCPPQRLGLPHTQTINGMIYYFSCFHSKYFIYFNVHEKKEYNQHVKQILLFRLIISFLSKLFSEKGGLQFKQIK